MNALAARRDTVRRRGLDPSPTRARFGRSSTTSCPAYDERGIWINEPGRVFVARHGRTELTTTIFTAQAVRDLVERMLKPSGRRLDLSIPAI